MRKIEQLLPGFRYYAAPGVCLEDTYFGDKGTIGVIAIDRMTGRRVAITAMHVFNPLTEYPAASAPKEIKVRSPCSGGASEIVGNLVRGTRTGVDAAAVDVEDVIVTNTVSGLGRIEFWRPTSSSDVNARVRMAGAFSQKISTGTILKANVAVPDLSLESAIVVEIAAQPGDSGGPLVDDSNRLLGLLVGGNETRQYFCSIGPIWSRLQCTLL